MLMLVLHYDGRREDAILVSATKNAMWVALPNSRDCLQNSEDCLELRLCNGQ